MKTWQGLYAMVWVSFLAFLLEMTRFVFPALSTALLAAHVGVGVAIVGLAYANFSRLLATTVPGRVKRIAKSTLQMAVAAGVIGVLLGLRLGETLVIPLVGVSIFNVFQFFHAVVAFAIITQAAAAAIGYDMWEEREFEKESEPGVVPPNPAVQAAAKKA